MSKDKPSSDIEDPKKDGNRCMDEKKYIEAMLHYTRAIKLCPKDGKLHSNRSLAFLRIQQHFHALEDALMCIKLEPSWYKGYFRKGEVEFDTGHYKEAMETYKEGLKRDPKNQELADAATKAEAKWKEQTKSENRMPWYGGGVGLAFSVMLIVLDENLLDPPIIENDVYKFLIAFLATAFGYGLMVVYTLMLQSQRCSLLDPPIDLFPGHEQLGLSTKENALSAHSHGGSTASSTTSPSPSETSPASTARQRGKKPKKA